MTPQEIQRYRELTSQISQPAFSQTLQPDIWREYQNVSSQLKSQLETTLPSSLVSFTMDILSGQFDAGDRQRDRINDIANAGYGFGTESDITANFGSVKGLAEYLAGGGKYQTGTSSFTTTMGQNRQVLMPVGGPLKPSTQTLADITTSVDRTLTDFNQQMVQAATPDSQTVIAEAMSGTPYDQLSPEAQQYRSTGQLPTSGVSVQPGAVSGVTGASAGQSIPSQGVYRDQNNNFYVNGQYITQDQFQQLGINETFVPLGQTVSLQQATTGQEAPQQSATDQIKQYIESLYNQGYVLNPNVQITPEKVAEFTKQAENEIDPYYRTSLKLAREQLLSSAGYTVDQIGQYETGLEQTYGKNIRTLQAGAAEQGFAQSGGRVLSEQQLAQTTQQQILQNRQSAQQTLANQGRTFAQQYGGMFGEQAPQGPQIGAMPTVSAGSYNFDRTGVASPFYQLSNDVYSGLVGEQEFGRRSAEQQRASQLEEAWRAQQTIPRTLTL